MGQCVYCPNDADSREHWFAKSFGAICGKDTTLLDRLCESCNNTLGREVDQEFAKTGITGYARQAYGIKEPETSVFNYRASHKTPPTQMRMLSPRETHQVAAETRVSPGGGQPQVVAMRQLVFKVGDGVKCVPWSKDWKAEHLRKALEQHGVADAELLEIYLDEDETPESLAPRQLLHDAGLRFTQVNCWYGGNNDEGTVKGVSIEWSLTYRYMRGVAKLGFHYFMWSCRAYRGDENQFSEIRAFIRHGQGDWQQFVNPFAPAFVPQIEQRVGKTPRHYLTSLVNERDVVVRTHLFVGPTIPPAAIIRVGSSPQRIAGETITAHEVAYFDRNQRDVNEGYVGEIVEAEAGTSRIIRVVPKWPRR